MKLELGDQTYNFVDMTVLNTWLFSKIAALNGQNFQLKNNFALGKVENYDADVPGFEFRPTSSYNFFAFYKTFFLPFSNYS